MEHAGLLPDARPTLNLMFTGVLVDEQKNSENYCRKRKAESFDL